MQVFQVFAMAIAAALAAGSGPYLPSGWKPKGPAFLLPTEVEKSSDIDRVSDSGASKPNTVEEYILPDFQDVYQAVTKQELPDLYTEKPFAVIVANTSEIQNTANLISSNGFQSDNSVFEQNAIDDVAILKHLDSDQDELVEGERTTDHVLDAGFDTEDKSTANIKAVKDAGIEVVDAGTSTKDDDHSAPQTKESEAQVIGFKEYALPTRAGHEKLESLIKTANENRRRRFSSKYVIGTNKH